LFEVNTAAEIVHGVAHQDANIIFGTVIDDELGDEVRVTVIAAGFDRWDAGAQPAPRRKKEKDATELAPVKDLFGKEDEDPLEGDDDFDVPSFLK
jgi:cell division protein FtsZ